jgi:hypothetical protein
MLIGSIEHKLQNIIIYVVISVLFSQVKSNQKQGEILIGKIQCNKLQNIILYVVNSILVSPIK